MVNRNERAKVYDVWRRMLDRCYCDTDPAFRNYGARGIRVCDDWHTFNGFLTDMWPRPEGGTLDRIDNAAGYSKANCQWVSRLENNRRTSRIVMTPTKLSLIRDMRAAGFTCKAIGERVGVGTSHVSQVLRGKLWAAP